MPALPAHSPELGYPQQAERQNRHRGTRRGQRNLQHRDQAALNDGSGMTTPSPDGEMQNSRDCFSAHLT